MSEPESFKMALPIYLLFGEYIVGQFRKFRTNRQADCTLLLFQQSLNTFAKDWIKINHRVSIKKYK